MMKNDFPVPANEEERLLALMRYQILDTSSDEDFNRLTELASIICDVPMSMVSFIDDKRQWIKSSCGIDVVEAPRDVTFCQYTIMNTDLVEVQDATQDDRFRENEFVTSDPFIRFYAGYPLIEPDGYPIGTFCVLDTKAKKLSEAQIKGLKLLAEQAVTLTVNQRRREELRYFERLFELSNDLICIIDKNGFFEKINPAFERVLGWDRDYLLRRSIWDLVHREDRANLVRVWPTLPSENFSINFLSRFQTRNNEFLYLQWVATVEPGTGNVFAIARDISVEKMNADKLRISEDKFRSFFENSQGMLCTHDLNGNFLSINPTVAGLLGLPSPNPAGYNLRDLIPAKHHSSMAAYLHEIEVNGKATGLMTTLSYKGTHTAVWSYNNILVKNPDGPDYVIGNAIDITESHRLAREVNRMQEMLLQTNQMAKVGGWEINMITQKTYWSEVTRQIHQADDAFEFNLESLFGFYKKESRQKLSLAMNDAIIAGKGYDLELELVTARGEELWIRIIGNSEFENGKCKRLYGTIQDIDRRKKSELELVSERARLRAFVEHAPAAVAMFDKEIRYLAVSQKWLEEYRLAGENILGLSHYEVFPNISDHWKDIHQRCLQGEIFAAEEERWRPVGWEQDQFIKWEVRPWFLFDGSIGGVMMFTQDITDAAMRREELKEAKRQSELANMAKSEFLANMSHEIRTPLNGVIGFTDLVLKTKMTDTQRQYLSIVSQSAHTLLNIINDILDFSKIEAGKLELDVAKCDIYDIASQSADIISFLVQSKGLEMLLNIPDALPQFVWTDEIRLKQVLVNLLSNAAKFTDQGEIELKLEVLSMDSEPGGEICCRFTVRDTGIGIREEKQSKIFEAFLQEDGSTSKKYGGTGLGLTISNNLLGMMGSELKLISERGVGSTFFFDLVMKFEHGVSFQREKVMEVKRVLVVDDNRNNLLIMEKMLDVLHIDSVQAQSGSEALAILKSDENFDAIFVDYHMPEMDGLETVRQIRANQLPGSKKHWIVLLSSSVDRATINQLEGNEINYRLTKPLKLVDIVMCFTRLSSSENFRQQTVDVEVFDRKNPAKFNVLIAEDNPANMFLTRTVIANMAPNATIVEARNGNEALHLCAANLPDIILMDVQMPEMNGYEATRAIKQLHGALKLPIIALTAGNVKGEREKCLEAGMVDFVTKPFTQEAIWQVLGRVEQFAAEEEKLSKVQFPLKPGMASFDVGKLRSAYMDDEQFIEEILALTKESLKENLADLKSFYAIRDFARLKATSHKLKGVAKAVFLADLSETALELEMMTIYDHDLIGLLLSQLEGQIEVLLPLLEK